MARNLNLDLAGRLRNFRLPHHRALVPLFEAIVNSLHAVEVRDGRGRRNVSIRVLRADQQTKLKFDGDHVVESEIVGFEIEDDGIGFTEENFRSFCTSDSTFKQQAGGRGVGRFTWLKAFEQVSIESVYLQDEKPCRRSFSFTSDGISNTKVVDAQDEQRRTVVRLTGIRNGYLERIPKRLDTLAARVVDHCFAVIQSSSRTRVTMSDDNGHVDISETVSTVYNGAEKDSFDLAGSRFSLVHLKITLSEHQHQISYLANGREVQRDNLARIIPQLRRKLETDNGEQFWWWTLVSSKALDENVSGERDEFTLPEDPLPQYPNELTVSGIKDAARTIVRTRVEPFLQPLRAAAATQVQDYVQKAPEYRYLITVAPDRIAQIPPDLDERKLELELHRIQYEVDLSIREKGEKLLREEHPDESKYDEWLAETNYAGKAKLAQYIVHRRRMLDLFARALKIKAETGKHELESAVHKIIFPLRSTSDEVRYEAQNLWIIDERLAYHFYLASDKSLAAVPFAASQSSKRPDLLIFDHPFAFAEGDAPYRAIIIVEFKRPARDDYDDTENPINQVLDYVRELRSGGLLSREGRPLNVRKEVPVYCYVVCDITRKLKQQVENVDLTPAPDGMGFFGYNSQLTTYIEVISFDKLLADAEKRNRILFEKLGLSKP